MFRKLLLVAALGFVSPAYANTYMSSMSDLWWNENESGWGVTITHQKEVVFHTFFIYGADGKAQWYTGQANYTGVNSQGAYIFTGNMYSVVGPWFGAVFSPNLVTARLAGTVTLTAFLNQATLTYTIDGVTINKVITRQTFRNDDVSGSYMGAIKSTQSGCRFPYVNGDFNYYIDITISNTANTFAMAARSSDGDTCNYSGNYLQTGRIARSQGNYVCSSGAAGTYDAIEIEANLSGFTGRYSASGNYCSSSTGRFAAMRK